MSTFQDLLKSCPEFVVQTSSTSKIWTDDDIKLNNDQILEHLETATVKNLAKQWLNAYITGTAEEYNLSHAVMVFLYAGQFPGEKPLNHFNTHGQLKNEFTPSGTWKAVQPTDHYFQEAEQQVQNLPGSSATTADNVRIDNSTSDSVPTKIQIKDVEAFYKGMNDLLDSPDNALNQSALNILQFINLVLVRLMVKTTSSVVRYMSERAKEVFTALYNQHPVFPFVPPSSGFLTSFRLGVKKGTMLSVLMFRNILNVKYQNDNRSTPNKEVEGVLTATCLLHLRLNGMTSLKAVLHLSNITRRSVKELIEYSSYKCYESSLRSLLKVLLLHYEPGKVSKYFSWCRIIDDSYHSELGSQPNKEYLTLLYYAISQFEQKDGIERSDIWNQKPFDGKPSIPAGVKRWYLTLKSMIEPDMSEVLTPGALKFQPQSDEDDDDDEILS